MFDIAPEAVVAESAFGNKAMDMGVPFQVPAKGMEHHNKTWGEIHGFIVFIKHLGNNTVYRME